MHPETGELEAVCKCILFAENTGARIHIAHVSSVKTVALIEEAKKRGVRITCETCPHYLLFSDQDYDEKGELLLVRRGKDPGKGTLDLPGGFVDMYENGEEAAAREVKEETGLDIHNCHYLFSIPNIYPYKGFVVHTLDMFFECTVKDFLGAKADDDAEEIVVCRPEELSPVEFGLDSIRKAVERFLKEKTRHKK